MATRAHLEDADRRMRSIIAQAGLPEPDEVNYHEDDGELELLWYEPKLAVIVECGDGCAMPEFAAGDRDGETRSDAPGEIPF
jgi:hypothetical protein